jgi:hypothetical protein
MSKGESRPRTNPEAKNPAEPGTTLTHEELVGVTGGLQAAESGAKRSEEESRKTVQ